MPEFAALKSAIAGSTAVAYHGTGHALHWDEPERFAADLTAFIRHSVVGHRKEHTQADGFRIGVSLPEAKVA